MTGSAGTSEIPFGTLPAGVRAVILGWAADALGATTEAQIPASLVRVARFTPGKRARLGATALAAAVDQDPAFRAVVAERVRTVAGTDEVAGWGPAAAAAMAHLLRWPDEAELVEEAGAADATGSDAEVAELRAELRATRRRLDMVVAERDALAGGRGGVERQDPATPTVERMRQRLRDQGTRLRAAMEAVVTAGRAADARIAEISAELERARAEAAEGRRRAESAAQRAERAEQSLGAQRESAGRQRSGADRRLELLLATLESAAGGLRRQLNLIGGGPDPADLIAARLSVSPTAGEAAQDPGRLNAWLAMPVVHLIVDGYNVTKTGYADLTLADQRDRLVRSLGALSARTSGEVTVVFDGAAVVAPPPIGRGVRVLFSPPGVPADDVIVDLVSAEPFGRVVVVVTSDREVADAVRRRGARTAASGVLLGLIG